MSNPKDSSTADPANHEAAHPSRRTVLANQPDISRLLIHPPGHLLETFQNLSMENDPSSSTTQEGTPKGPPHARAKGKAKAKAARADEFPGTSAPAGPSAAAGNEAAAPASSGPPGQSAPKKSAKKKSAKKAKRASQWSGVKKSAATAGEPNSKKAVKQARKESTQLRKAQRKEKKKKKRMGDAKALAGSAAAADTSGAAYQAETNVVDTQMEVDFEEAVAPNLSKNDGEENFKKQTLAAGIGNMAMDVDVGNEGVGMASGVKGACVNAEHDDTIGGPPSAGSARRERDAQFAKQTSRPQGRKQRVHKKKKKAAKGSHKGQGEESGSKGGGGIGKVAGEGSGGGEQTGHGGVAGAGDKDLTDTADEMEM